MAYVTIKYQRHSFEENPGLITWIQLYLIKFIQTIDDRPEWTNSIIDEWKMNSEIEIYKYIFDETMLDDSCKTEWCIDFLDKALSELNNMRIQEFAAYIHEDINPIVDFERIKKIVLNVKRLLENQEPVKTHQSS